MSATNGMPINDDYLKPLSTLISKFEAEGKFEEQVANAKRQLLLPDVCYVETDPETEQLSLTELSGPMIFTVGAGILGIIIHYVEKWWKSRKSLVKYKVTPSVETQLTKMRERRESIAHLSGTADNDLPQDPSSSKPAKMMRSPTMSSLGKSNRTTEDKILSVLQSLDRRVSLLQEAKGVEVQRGPLFKGPEYHMPT